MQMVKVGNTQLRLSSSQHPHQVKRRHYRSPVQLWLERFRFVYFFRASRKAASCFLTFLGNITHVCLTIVHRCDATSLCASHYQIGLNDTFFQLWKDLLFSYLDKCDRINKALVDPETNAVREAMATQVEEQAPMVAASMLAAWLLADVLHLPVSHEITLSRLWEAMLLVGKRLGPSSGYHTALSRT
jgi:hypothetical protein